MIPLGDVIPTRNLISRFHLDRPSNGTRLRREVCSVDGRFRYMLEIRNPDVAPVREALWILLNPPMLSASQTDRILPRVATYSEYYGCDAWTVVWRYARRAVHPTVLNDLGDAVGPATDDVIDCALEYMATLGNPLIVCAWGDGMGSSRVRRLYGGQIPWVTPPHYLSMRMAELGLAPLCPGLTKQRGEPRGDLTSPQRRPLEPWPLVLPPSD